MKSLNIGLVAYGVDPSMVFVRVPNERGRWMLVDRAVVEVDCPHCKAVAGEPCRAVKHWSRDGVHDPIRYHVGIHVRRKEAWSEAAGARFPAKRAGPHKLRIRADELGALQASAPDIELVAVTADEICQLKKIDPFFGLFVQGEAERNGGRVCAPSRALLDEALFDHASRLEVIPKEPPCAP